MGNQGAALVRNSIYTVICHERNWEHQILQYFQWRVISLVPRILQPQSLAIFKPDDDFHIIPIIIITLNWPIASYKLRSFILIWNFQEDEPSSADKAVQGNAQNFHHFDHSFKAEIHTTSGPTFIKEFGECAYANRQVQVICKGSTFEIIEDVGISNRKSVQIAYKQVSRSL